MNKRRWAKLILLGALIVIFFQKRASERGVPKSENFSPTYTFTRPPQNKEREQTQKKRENKLTKKSVKPSLNFQVIPKEKKNRDELRERIDSIKGNILSLDEFEAIKKEIFKELQTLRLEKKWTKESVHDTPMEIERSSYLIGAMMDWASEGTHLISAVGKALEVCAEDPKQFLSLAAVCLLHRRSLNLDKLVENRVPQRAVEIANKMEYRP